MTVKEFTRALALTAFKRRDMGRFTILSGKDGEFELFDEVDVELVRGVYVEGMTQDAIDKALHLAWLHNTGAIVLLPPDAYRALMCSDFELRGLSSVYGVQMRDDGTLEAIE